MTAALARAIDAAGYAIALTVLASSIAGLVSAILGAGLVGVKLGLFLVGFASFGYAALLLRPGTPRTERVDASPRGETRFEELVSQLPLLRARRLPPDRRLSPGVKLFLASLVMLATSYAMEALIGI